LKRQEPIGYCCVTVIETDPLNDLIETVPERAKPGSGLGDTEIVSVPPPAPNIGAGDGGTNVIQDSSEDAVPVHTDGGMPVFTHVTVADTWPPPLGTVALLPPPTAMVNRHSSGDAPPCSTVWSALPPDQVIVTVPNRVFEAVTPPFAVTK
jgi:hypothetical protein